MVAERLEHDWFAFCTAWAYMDRLERGDDESLGEAVVGLADLREFSDIVAMERTVGDESAQGVALPKRAV